MEQRKKILLFGATGMAGHMIYYVLQSTGKYEIVNVVYRTKLTEDSIVADITNKETVVSIIKEIQPELIINCIGILLKGSCEHPDNAIYVNAYFPHLLKKLSDNIGARLIHISTDCVFSGKKGNYMEKDFKDADDIYGRSKALGEIINDKDLTIRTSIIGPELKQNGEGLFHWFMQQSGEINGFSKAIWGGVTTLELAKAIDRCIEENLTGLIHLTNGKKIAKYDLLHLIKTIWNKNDVLILPNDNIQIDKSIAKSERFDFFVPDYNALLLELYHFMNQHKNLYTPIYKY